MNVARIGLDLAKSVFQVHDVDAAGHAVVPRRLARSQLLEFFGRLPARIIGWRRARARTTGLAS
jgi:transposase